MKNDKTLIVGQHPIIVDIVRQFESRGAEVHCVHSYADDSFLPEEWSDIVLLPCSGANVQEADEHALRWLQSYAERITPCACQRPVVHLMLQSQEHLFYLNTRDYNDEWHDKFELSAFTLEDTWAKRILSCCSAESCYKPLDHVPVELDSQHIVHLVVFGTSAQTLSIVENAALVAHYPNYTRDHSLRTRITVIDECIVPWRAAFISRHRALMDNSYHRFIDVEGMSCETSRPMYDNREDFVDVEWEFVKGSVHDTVVHDKLLAWASDDRQVLTLVISHEDDDQNIGQMRIISELLMGCSAPIYVKQHNATMLTLLTRSPRLQNVIPFGMDDSGYDVDVPLLRMAKRVKYVYDYCYDHNIVSDVEGSVVAPSHIDDKEAEAHWLTERKAIKRYSNLCNALTIRTKMRSLGHSENDSSTFYAISRQEVETIGQVEHNRWSVEEMLLGYRPCSDEEQQDVEADITWKNEYKQRLVHYDLRAYNDLRVDDTGKNVNTYDLCLSAAIPLIAFGFSATAALTEKKGGET